MSAAASLVLRPSPGLAAAVAAAHAVALWSAWIGLPLAAAAVVSIALAASAIHHARAALHRSPSALAALRVDGQGRLFVAAPGEAWCAATLIAWAAPAHWLVTLVVRDASGRALGTIVFPGRCADPEEFRRLRVWLRWQPPRRADQDKNSPQQ